MGFRVVLRKVRSPKPELGIEAEPEYRMERRVR
jgi:hypothetical protein